VIGLGFQSFKPSLFQAGNTQTEVTHISCFSEDKILVSYSNQSLAVFSIPSLALISTLDSSWLGTKTGDITVIYTDENGDRNYAYVGTSAGHMFVLEMLPVFRVCDYSFTASEAGIPVDMIVSDIKTSPKVSQHDQYDTLN